LTTNSYSYDQAPTMPFLSDSFVKDANKILQLPDEITEAYHKAHILMSGNIALRKWLGKAKPL
jgi:hypothetical protein